MDIEQSFDYSIPWTARDVWLGVVCLAVWWVIFLIGVIWVEINSLQLDLGLIMGLCELVLIIPAWWFSVRKYQVSWSKLGLRGFKGKMMVLGFGLMLSTFVFNFIYNGFLALLNLRAQADLIPIFEQMSSPEWLLITGIVIAPFVEELVFRGFIFEGLKQRYTWKKAALISSGLFSIMHLQPLAILPIFILGYIFAYLYHKSKSIWPGIVLHVSSNALALGAAYLIANMGIEFGSF